jgi:hypothetical protein
MHHIKKKRGDKIPKNINIISIDPFLSNKPEDPPLSRHNPLYSKHPEDHIPQISHIITMKKEMIRSFPTIFTNTTPIHHYYVMLVEIIQGGDFSQGSGPREGKKKVILKGTLVLQMLFQGEESMLGTRT